MRSGILVVLAAAAAAASGCGKAGEQYAREVVHAVDQGKLLGTKGNMETLGRALAAYAVDRGGYPRGGLPDATAALTPAFLAAPVTIDAWGRTFAYASDGTSFTLTSTGQDGSPDTDDDVVMVDGRFTRLPSPSR